MCYLLKNLFSFQLRPLTNEVIGSICTIISRGFPLCLMMFYFIDKVLFWSLSYAQCSKLVPQLFFVPNWSLSYFSFHIGPSVFQNLSQLVPQTFFIHFSVKKRTKLILNSYKFLLLHYRPFSL